MGSDGLKPLNITTKTCRITVKQHTECDLDMSSDVPEGIYMIGEFCNGISPSLQMPCGGILQ